MIKLRIENSGDDFTIFLISINVDVIDIKSYVKKIIIKLKNKINKNIGGYYNVKVYLNKIYGMIINLEKTGDFDFFKDFLELNIKIYEDSKIYYRFEDYFAIINKNNIYYYNDSYYIDIEELSKKDLLCICEFGEIVYGEKLNNIMIDLKKIDMCYNN